MGLNIIILYSKVEILHSSVYGADILLKELQECVQEFVNILYFSIKTPHLQRAILLGVPETVNFNFIVASTTNKYNFFYSEFKLPRIQSSRTEGFHGWILLIVPPLLRAIILDGGLYIELKRFNITPHRKVQRYRYCQSLGHSEK